MKIAIIGAGAMGSIYASFLARNNNDVLAIDLWEEHLSAIKNNGLRVSGFSGDNVVNNINVSNNIKDAIGYELFVIAELAYLILLLCFLSIDKNMKITNRSIVDNCNAVFKS